MTQADYIVAGIALAFMGTVAVSNVDFRHGVRQVAASAVALVFYGPGYITGACVRFVRWARAAIVAGYKHGRGAT